MSLIFIPTSLHEYSKLQNQFNDLTIHQTEQWMKFLVETQGGEPVFGVLESQGSIVGRFSGLVITKMGHRILGSPFPGWSTTFMGFNLKHGISRIDAVNAVKLYAFESMKCKHFECMDRLLTFEEAASAGYETWNYETFEIDLTNSVESIFKNMKHQCRNCIRKAERSGVTIEVVNDSDWFAQEYYKQVVHVFETKGLPPPFDLGRVESLINNLFPTGNLTLLSARNKDDICIATGIFTVFNGVASAWGAANYRDYSEVRPNEAIFWYAIKHFKALGAHTLDLVGAAEYKKKYGGIRVGIPWIRKSADKITAVLRTYAEKTFLRFPRLYNLVSRLR